MRVRLGTPFRERSSSVEHSSDTREVKRAARFAPTIFEGIAQSARADASHASGRRRKSFCPHHFCPCGVVQSTRLPLMQEITGAKPVRDTTFTALKALSAMPSLGKRISPVQLRVRAPSQSSQRSSGFHKPAVSGAAPEIATILRQGLGWQANSFRLHAAACGFLL